MSDLPARLRAAAHERYFNKPELLVEAADALEALEREVAECPFHGPVAHWDLP